MPEFLNNPQSLLILCGVGLLVFVINAPILYMLVGKPPTQPISEATHWGKALRGGFDRRQQQMAQIDELHQRLAQLPEAQNPHDQ